MKHAAIKKADGSISIVHGDISRAVEAGESVVELTDSQDLPDAKYRNCWREKAGEIVIDLPLARAQRLEEIRAERDEKLAESDKEWMIAMSQGAAADVIAAVNAKKLALRDLPEAAELALKKCKKIETIDAYKPDWS